MAEEIGYLEHDKGRFRWYIREPPSQRQISVARNLVITLISKPPNSETPQHPGNRVVKTKEVSESFNAIQRVQCPRSRVRSDLLCVDT